MNEGKPMESWRVVRSAHALPQVFAGDECVTDRVFNGHESLIAAAPDLLASLQALLPILVAVRYSVGLGKSQLERIAKAEAAIAKARATA